MSWPAPEAVPLLARPPEAVLFRHPEGVVTAAAFLGAARALAARLPATPLLNLCADPCHVALGLAAAALAGQVSLLSGDRSPAWLAALAAQHPGLAVLSEDAPPIDLPWLAPRLDVRPDATAPPALPPERLAAIVFTSGTTGAPAGHRKLWGALVSRSRDAMVRFGLGDGANPAASVVGTVPGQHMYGIETTVLLPLHAGTSSWCGPGFFPSDVAAALAACPAPRVLVTTPLHLRALLESGVTLAPLARVISATAPLDAAMAGAAERAWNTRVDEIFGATELGSIASRHTVAEATWQLYPNVRLSARDGGFDVEAPFAPPWKLSDRVARIGADRFRLLGRGTDLVKLGGRRASLAGLTQILTGIAGVTDGIFVAPPDLEARPTARMLAFAVAPGLSADDILAALRGRIDPVFLPRRVILLDRLPRDALGKLPAGALAALAADPP